MMVQVPEARNVVMAPETVQTPVVADEYVMDRPEVAVAERVSGMPTVCADTAGKVMVWEVSGAVVTVLEAVAAERELV